MKRTGPLKRKTPIQNRSELKTKAPMERKPMERRGLSSTKRASASNKRRSVSPVNDNRWRSPAYLAWVRRLPCCVCGAPADSAHHLIGMWQVSGMGLKAPDSLVMPVCDGPGGCHARIHAEKALRDQQPGFLRHTIARGVRQFGGDIGQALREAWAFIDEKEAA